ncbi:response regulator [Undibacterium sp. RuRC25W]|uniref:response regulator n=1 Tax=Undibacterium sp. RuRC25W TaxID=3413047 RepID=UPI003BF39986
MKFYFWIGKCPSWTVLRSQEEFKKLNLNAIPHMLMVTAYGREEVLQEAERAGIENVLIKPVNASMLFDSVMRLFNDIHDIHSDGSGDTVYDNGAALRTDTANGQTAAFKQLATIRGAHILLVEDNDLNQEVALELLRSAGFNVDLAENGEIAVAKVRAADYQLVLMDMQMPVMDGVTATIEIRKDPRCKDLPIVAMTANAMKGDRDRCLAAGMNDHVPKPIEPEDLWKAILKWVTPLHPTQTTQTVIGLEDETAVVPVLTPDMTPPLSLVILAENLSRQASVLDTKVALRRLLGKQELYQKLLDMFLAGQKTVVADITDALNKEDWILAERVVHTLRGASANIGATQLPTLLAQLETAIRSHQPRAAVDDFLHQIVQPLQRLIAEIERIVPREQDNPSITEIDHVKLEKLCLTLRTLLSEHDAQANKVTSTNADLLRAAFPNEYALIAENIDAFRYEAALVLLDSALRSLSPTD